VFSRSDRLRPNTISNRLNGTKSNKSSVDDFDMELGLASSSFRGDRRYIVSSSMGWRKHAALAM
jgi:hypothetical protein